MKKLILLSLAILLLAQLTPFAYGGECSEVICIQQVKMESDGYKIYAENISPLAQKIQMTINGKNIRVSPDEAVNTILPAFERRLLQSVEPKNINKPWSYGYKLANREAEGSYRDCFQDTVCLNVIFSDDTFEFFVENISLAPVTVRIVDSGFENLRTSSRLPSVNTYPSSSTSLAFTAELQDEWKSWSHPTQVKFQTGTLNPRHDNTVLYRLPYALGETFKVSQGFNGKLSHKNIYAIDWNMAEGTPVHAARSGVVIATEESHSEGGIGEKYKAMDNYVHILHDDGTIGAYVHLKQGGASVNIGDKIVAGDKIGDSGSTGYSSGPHLHFEVFGLNLDLERDTIPIRFLTQDGKKELKPQTHYTAIEPKAKPKTKN